MGHGCWFPEVWKFLPPFSLCVKQHTHFFPLPTQSILPPPEHCNLVYFRYTLEYFSSPQIFAQFLSIYMLHSDMNNERFLCCPLNIFNRNLSESMLYSILNLTAPYQPLPFWAHTLYAPFFQLSCFCKIPCLVEDLLDSCCRCLSQQSVKMKECDILVWNPINWSEACVRSTEKENSECDSQYYVVYFLILKHRLGLEEKMGSTNCIHLSKSIWILQSEKGETRGVNVNRIRISG